MLFKFKTIFLNTINLWEKSIHHGVFKKHYFTTSLSRVTVHNSCHITWLKETTNWRDSIQKFKIWRS